MPRLLSLQVNLSIKHAQEDLRDCDVRRSEAEARLLTAMRATSDAELNLRKIRPNLTLCALLAEHERQISEVAEAGLAKLQAACDRLSSTQGLLHVAATSRHASAYAALPEAGFLLRDSIFFARALCAHDFARTLAPSQD